jgi:hypothetical protein
VAAPRWYSALIALDPNKLRVRVQMRYMRVDVLGLRRGEGCRNTILSSAEERAPKTTPVIADSGKSNRRMVSSATLRTCCCSAASAVCKNNLPSFLLIVFELFISLHY